MHPPAPLRTPFLWLALLAASLLTAACGSVDAVQTEAPEAAAYEEEETELTRTVPLVVTLEAGSGSLPEEISRFRFRVGEIHVRAGDTTRWSRDAGQYEFALPRGRSEPAVLVRTHVRRSEIRSVAIEIARPYAEFGPNAGGPLTVRGSDSVRVELSPPGVRSASSYAIRLRLETGSSIERDEDCRWHFTPRITGRVSAEPAP